MLIKNETDTKNFVQHFASNLKKNDIIALNGNLGAGKSFICREIIQYFCGAHTNVISPTFNILQTYDAPNFTIYHYDLYRLKSKSEIYELGFEEALNNNLCLIEWPEIIASILPSPYINISIEILPNGFREIIVKNS
jgi:tRNA threonylcarbamoyladenosine biosynthesis protein TsaE